MTKKLRPVIPLLLVLGTVGITLAQTNVERELRRLNAKIEREKVRIDSLENQIRVLLPELKNALKATVQSKTQTDSVTVLLINRINTLQNKIRILEDKAAYTDSTNFEFLAQLVMIENKIVTLTNSFTELYNLKSEAPTSPGQARLTAAEYKKRYIDNLSLYQNGKYETAIKGFSELVITDPMNELADNSQYWLAESYYSLKNYKRAVIEFEKVFTFPGTDKDDDAQLKLGLCYQNMGNKNKARDEYQRLLDYFPSSEYYSKAKEALKQLSLEQ